MSAVKDLAIEDFERLIERVVRRTMDEYLEDLEALASPKYLASIREAREDYQAGRVTKLSGPESAIGGKSIAERI